jgi:putative restriction endonuclease
MARLSKKQLLGLLLRAIDMSGWQTLLMDASHPFGLRLFRNDEKGFDIRVYIWNCTHGGGSARAKDEYRVQLTPANVMPSAVPAGDITLLLGWHDGYGVFVSFDIAKHIGQASQSPSIQVKEETLINAHRHAFSVYERHNGELAVAFRPELFVEYILNHTSLHATGQVNKDLSLLNILDSLTDEKIESVVNTERKTVISQIARKYRENDFRRRVLGAYGHRCAMCAVQLELIDAAHIIPLAASNSTDETTNGIALCKLHHAAFDRNLISFDERYKIEVSEKETERLTNENRAGGLKEFKRHLKTAITLPIDKRDYPSEAYIREARIVRNWRK